MTFWVVKVVRVVKGACLSEERRVKSEKFDTLADYCYFTFHLTACATDMNQQS